MPVMMSFMNNSPRVRCVFRDGRSLFTGSANSVLTDPETFSAGLRSHLESHTYAEHAAEIVVQPEVRLGVRRRVDAGVRNQDGIRVRQVLDIEERGHTLREVI